MKRNSYFVQVHMNETKRNSPYRSVSHNPGFDDPVINTTIKMIRYNTPIDKRVEMIQAIYRPINTCVIMIGMLQSRFYW